MYCQICLHKTIKNVFHFDVHFKIYSRSSRVISYLLTNEQDRYTSVVMGLTLGTGTFKPEKNLVFFRIKSPGPHRCHPGKRE